MGNDHTLCATIKRASSVVMFMAWYADDWSDISILGSDANLHCNINVHGVVLHVNK